MNGNDETDAADANILLARNLLKKFQTKQQQRSSLPSSRNGSESGMPTYFNNSSGNAKLDNSSSCNESICNEGTTTSQVLSPSRESSRPPSSVCNANEQMLGLGDSHTHQQIEQFVAYNSGQKFSFSPNTEMNTTILKQQLAQKQLELDDALSKLQSLHKHYTLLHSAYSQLSSQNSSSNNDPSMSAEQIHQLRTALAAAIDEKMALQAEMRDLRAKLNALSLSASQQQPSQQIPSASPTNISDYELERRVKRLTSEKEHLLDTVRNQSMQIEQQRRECSGLEAKLVLIQQDRLDTQARLKGLYEEKAHFERSLEQLKQELAMRDIYLRQLTRHSNSDSAEGQMATGNPNLQSQASAVFSESKQHLEEELQRHKSELGELKKQMQAALEHHQSSSIQANNHIQRLEMELNRLKAANSDLEANNNQLEGKFHEAELKMRQLIDEIEKDKNIANATDVINEASQTGISQTQEQMQISKLAAERDELITQRAEMCRRMEAKDEQIESLEAALTEAQGRIMELDHRQNIQTTINSDAALLAAQLQNEKATVSRAVSQNMELKSQLAELQDRLVQVINESAAKEDERVSALAAVAQLKQQLWESMEIEQKRKNELENTAHLQGSLSEANQTDELVVTLNNEDQQQRDTNIISDELSKNQVEDEHLGLEKEIPKTIPVQTEHFDKQTAEIAHSTDESREQKVQETKANELLADSTPIPDKNNSIELDKQKQQEMSGQLEQRLEQMCKENQQFRMDNQKLQYWLTALETENESIGEYIALYHFQRGNIQKRIAEKDDHLQLLEQRNLALMAQLTELHNSVIAFLGQKQEENEHEQTSPEILACQQSVVDELTADQATESIETEREENDDTNKEQEVNLNAQTRLEGTDDELVHSEQQQSHSNWQEHPQMGTQMERLIQALEKSRKLGEILANKQPAATCSTAQESQIHCTGCMECRGEMFNV